MKSGNRVDETENEYNDVHFEMLVMEAETQKRLTEIEEKFKEKNQELEQDKKEEVKRIVRETDGDPRELAKRLSKLTGLSVASNDIE